MTNTLAIGLGLAVLGGLAIDAFLTGGRRVHVSCLEMDRPFGMDGLLAVT